MSLFNSPLQNCFHLTQKVYIFKLPKIKPKFKIGSNEILLQVPSHSYEGKMTNLPSLNNFD
jgi:hypothetical protein